MAFPSWYSKQDICSEIHNHNVSNVLIYFLPNYLHDQDGREELYADISRAALAGGVRNFWWGRGRGKQQVMYIRCQCSVVYCGSKVDKETWSIINRCDYCNSTHTNDCKNQRHGQKCRNGSHRTSIDWRLTKKEDCCSFSLAVYQGTSGYFLETTNCTGLHQYHH